MRALVIVDELEDIASGSQLLRKSAGSDLRHEDGEGAALLVDILRRGIPPGADFATIVQKQYAYISGWL